MEKMGAILFADITGSTTLYERLGNEATKKLVTDCLRLLSAEVTAHQGMVVQNIGDEIMCTFPTAKAAADAARQMQMSVLNHYSNSSVQLKIRVGFYWGAYLSEGNNLYGDAVNTAARMSSVAKGDQIFTSKSTIEAIADLKPDQYRAINTLSVKGKQEPILVCELIWREDGLTSFAGTPADTVVMLSDVPQLFLGVGGRDIVVGKERQSVKIGRTPEADIMLDANEVSRSHASIELRKDKFYLADHSTNGTRVRDSHGHELFLHREEAPLVGAGSIHCGAGAGVESSSPISFIIK